MENQNFTPLTQFTKFESLKSDDIWLTQPLGSGNCKTFTWASAGDAVRRMASYLLSLNLPAKSNIIILGNNNAEWILADLAIWMSGHISVPVYSTVGDESFSYIIEHCQAKAIVLGKLDGITDSWNQLKNCVSAEMEVIRLPQSPDFRGAEWEEIMRNFSPLEDYVKRDFDELATIIYTSGTTGNPKGVMHSFRSLTAPCNATKDLWRPSSNDRMLSYLPLAHVAERVVVEIPALMFGFQIYFNHSLETFPEDLRRARPSRFFSVPRLWTKFYQAVNAKLPPWKQKLLLNIPFVGSKLKKKILAQLGLDHAWLGFTGAAPLPEKILSWYRNLGLELLEVYGMTENAATSHATEIGNARSGYVGVTLPGVECKLDASGEILVKSPGQMLGYYLQPELSQEKLTPDGFFHTGDRGEFDEAGRLRITGRVNDLFKTSKGKFISPVPIENKLGSYPGLETVCVSGRGAPQPYVLATLSPEVKLSADDKHHFSEELSHFIIQLNAQLEDHERLDFLVICKDPWTIESGLLTPTMKLKRDQIEQKYDANVDNWRDLAKKVIFE